MKLLSAAFYTFLVFPLGAVIVFLVGMAGDRLGYIGLNVRRKGGRFALLFLPSFAFTIYFFTNPEPYGNPDGSGRIIGFVLMPAAAIGNFAAFLLFLKLCLPGSGPTSSQES
jgi:hypothetical protein